MDDPHGANSFRVRAARRLEVGEPFEQQLRTDLRSLLLRPVATAFEDVHAAQIREQVLHCRNWIAAAKSRCRIARAADEEAWLPDLMA